MFHKKGTGTKFSLFWQLWIQITRKSLNMCELLFIVIMEYMLLVS